VEDSKAFWVKGVKVTEEAQRCRAQLQATPLIHQLATSHPFIARAKFFKSQAYLICLPNRRNALVASLPNQYRIRKAHTLSSI
jgi:hypothetical protein